MAGAEYIVYREVDPKKKNCEWANSCINYFRMYWQRLVNVNRGWNDRNLLYSTQPLTQVEASFQDEDFKRDTQFLPLPIMEVFVNSVVEEITKNPPRLELKATDPAAVKEKKRDLQLLKSRKMLEGAISQTNAQIGLPPYKMPYDQFKGNVEEFDNMGLDERDPEDITMYEQHFQRLIYEMAGQAVLDNVMKINQFDDSTLRRIVKDVFAFKAICTQCYVDRITGQIKTRYIDPQIAKGLWGDTNDGKNDLCRGWEDSITINEWLAMVGNEFDWDRDWRHLLWAINYCNNQKFTGFIRNGYAYTCVGDVASVQQLGLPDQQVDQNLLNWSQAYQFKVYCGYIEWQTPEATGSYIRKFKDESFVQPVDYNYEIKKKKELKEYYKESFYQNQWYGSYFIATTSSTQWIYGFQKVYFQQLEGGNDEYSNGTLCYYQEEGKSAVEISKTYLQVANFAFYRMLWIIYKSKPMQDEYLLEELITLSKGLKKEFPQMAGANNLPSFDSILNQVINYQKRSHVRIRTYPQVEGKTVPQLPPEKGRDTGGLDPIAIAMQSITQWAEMNIGAKIGINPMRLGANPPSRESFDSEQSTLQASFNSTGYMYRMVEYLKKHLGTVILNYAQDIIKFKDSIPYNWLKTLIGDEAFGGLSVLEDFCAHRMGIFITDANNNMQRQRIMQAADIALAKGTLGQDEWYIVTQTEDPKRANALLTRMKRQKEKALQKQEMQKFQMQADLQKQTHAMKMEEIQLKGQMDLEKSKVDAQATIAAAQIGAKSKQDVKMLQVQSDVPKQQAKTEGEKEVLREQNNIKQQEPFSVGTVTQ